MRTYLYTWHESDDHNESICRHAVYKATDKSITIGSRDWGYLYDEYDPNFCRPKTFDDIVWVAKGRYDDGGGFYTRRIMRSTFEDGVAYHRPSRQSYFTDDAARAIFHRRCQNRLHARIRTAGRKFYVSCGPHSLIVSDSTAPGAAAKAMIAWIKSALTAESGPFELGSHFRVSESGFSETPNDSIFDASFVALIADGMTDDE